MHNKFPFSDKLLCLVWMSVGLLSVSLPIGSANTADMYWERAGANGSVLITIEGTILRGDEEKFRSLVLKLLRDGQVVDSVRVYSSGGAVDAALHIGRQIRTLRVGTISPLRVAEIGPDASLCMRRVWDEAGKELPEHSQRHWAHGIGPRYAALEQVKNDRRCICASACFLVWAAGLGRYGDWIGIHRPFFDPSEFGQLPFKEAKERYERMLIVVKGYLSEMGIPDSLVAKMMGYSSEEMYFISTDEAKSLGNAPAGAEYAVARCGSMLQWKTEYVEAKRKGEHKRAQELKRKGEAIMHCATEITRKEFFASGVVDQYMAKYGR